MWRWFCLARGALAGFGVGVLVAHAWYWVAWGDVSYGQQLGVKIDAALLGAACVRLRPDRHLAAAWRRLAG